MNKVIIVCVGLIVCLMGCKSYQDINRTVFTVVTIVDLDEDNKPIVYMETFRSLYSQENASEKGERSILTGRGDTIAEAVLDLNQMASFKIMPSHNKALIFTEKAARYGLDNYLDIFIRDQDYLLRPFIMIYEGDPKALLELEVTQEEFMGLYIEQIVQNEFNTSITYPKRLYEYASLRTMGDKTDVMILMTVEEREYPQIFIAQGAVVKEDKMVDKLTMEEVRIFTIIMEEHTSGYITIPHPELQGKYISLLMMKNKIKTDIQYGGKQEDVIKFKKKVTLRLSFEGTQKEIDLSDEKVRKQVEEGVKKKIIKESEALYQKFRNKDIDIFGVKKNFQNKYPQEYDGSVFKNSQLELEVDVYIEGSSNTVNFNH
ncbi:MAG: hypothetical protein CVV02_01160 [Firmicutes bacterium HGW-Firmicutes-7]|nr:MAG: hypothetical protein CVV02_01160 [Firmicutes bacterium HGW-Firmicutes-7]